MRHLDLFARERTEAKVLENGLKVLEKEYLVKEETRYSLMVFKPKAIKPLVNFIFKTTEAREKYLVQIINNFDNYQASRLVRKLERQGVGVDIKNAVKIGDIFNATWGYDQTNQDFYQVVSLNGRRATLRELGREITSSAGFMSNHVVPIKDSFKNEPLTKLVQFSDGKPYFKIESFAYARLWDGKEQYESHYA